MAPAKDIGTIVLLGGEEPFLRDRRARELEAEWTPAENPEYNLSVFHGPDLDFGAIVGACETFPLESPTRLVIVREFDIVDAAAHGGFKNYVERPNPSTRLLLLAASARGRKGAPSSSLKQVLAKIRVEEFALLRPDRALEFVKDAARARGVGIAPDAARGLIEIVGVDAARLDSEIEKASLFTEGRRIESKDVELLAWRTRGHTLFELTDAIARGDRDELLRHLGALFDDGNDALSLLGMAAWHLRRTLRAATLLDAGESAGQVARAVGINWGLADRFADTSRRLGTLGAVRALRGLRRVDVRLKSTAEDKRRAVERALVELLPPRA